jgi:Xaa-Pro aminopeptidase
VVSSLEAGRIAQAAPDVEVLDPYELGLDELIGTGLRWDELEAELCARAARRLGAQRLVVPGELPVAVADRLRADGVEVVPDQGEFIQRRRSKSEAELAGIRRAQSAADAGMAAAAELLRAGEPLTAEQVRARIREVCADHGAPASEDIIVAAGPAGATGHEQGTGPLRPGTPIVIDIWPRDEVSTCFADMTRTFVVGGQPPPEVVAWHVLCGEALGRVYAILRPGVTGRELFEAACDVFEAGGELTQRTKPEGESLRDGFFHSLGHGVGLETHEEPALGAFRQRAAGGGRRGGDRAGLLPPRIRWRAPGGPRPRHRRRLRAPDELSLRARALIAQLVAHLVAQLGEVDGLVGDQDREQDREQRERDQRVELGRQRDQSA